MDHLAVYIHWPFCLSMCPYCDFNSHVAEGTDQQRWRAAYRAEIGHAAAAGPRLVTSVYFGGGTPSLMEPATVAAVLQAVGGAWTLQGDAEITLEANPTSVETGRLAEFRDAGINRVSLGVQSLDQTVLDFLGRTHTVPETRAAIEAAAGIYERWSMDLIYARPGQNLTAWRAELDDALGYGPRHLSAYQLTIEKGTPFFAAHRDGAFTLPGEDLGAALYEATGDALRAAGLAAYEVSNYAAPGEESRHNLSYWRYRDYAGIGPGAHGRVTVDGTVRATRRIAAPQAWLQQVEAKGHGLQGDEALGPRTVRDEVTMMGLRLAEGIERGAFEARTGQSFEAAFDAGRWSALVDEGLLILGATHIRATRTGRLRLNALLSHLLDH